MTRRHPTKRNRQGAALILALTLMTIFSVLGTSFIVSMSLELDEARLAQRETRARHLAEAGIHAAIGDLGVAVRESRQADLLAQRVRTYEFPAYRGVMTDDGYALERAPRISYAEVTVSDESGKLNLNHAPASMLRLILNVDGATARNITSSLPLPSLFAPGTKDERKWLSGPDELLSRGLLTPEQYAALDLSHLTTLTVPATAKPERFLNVNAVSAVVLAALLDIPLEQAQQATVRRPFNSLADLEAAAGKPANTFNIKPRFSAPDALPPELSLESRCFRITSKALYGLQDQGVARRSSAWAEAVVVFDGDGGYEIVHWSTDNAEDEPLAEAEPTAEADGEVDEALESPAPADADIQDETTAQAS